MAMSFRGLTARLSQLRIRQLNSMKVSWKVVRSPWTSNGGGASRIYVTKSSNIWIVGTRHTPPPIADAKALAVKRLRRAKEHGVILRALPSDSVAFCPPLIVNESEIGMIMDRAGKALESTVTEAVVEFERPPRPLFADADCRPGPNRMTFRTKPDDGISFWMQAKKPGPAMVSRPIELHLEHDRPKGRAAYDRLIGDALRGDPSLFARQDEVMEQWRIVDQTLADSRLVARYARGSWGPPAADALLGTDWSWITK